MEQKIKEGVLKAHTERLNEQEQATRILSVHAQDQKTWLVGLSLTVLFTFLVMVFCINGVENKITMVTTYIGEISPLPSGYHEECYQSKIVEHHEMVDTKTCNITTFRQIISTGDIELTFYGDCPLNKTLNLHYVYPESEATATYQVTPYINYWNETVCTKTILVKDKESVPTITFDFQ